MDVISYEIQDKTKSSKKMRNLQDRCGKGVQA